MCDCRKSCDEYPKYAKFKKVVTKKLTVCDEAKFKGDVTIDGEFCLKDPITISVPDMHSGANLSKPTIQEAVDYFKGRHAMRGRILISSGTYLENGIFIDRLSSSSSLNSLTETPVSFSIIGDTRDISGQSYVHDSFLANSSSSAGIGDNEAAVTLSGGANTITVTATNVDFVAAGVVAGDKIKIKDDSGVVEERSVTNVAADTLTYDGLSLTVGGYGSALVFLPSVEVASSVDGAGIFQISGCSLLMQGLRINDSAIGAAATTHGLVLRDSHLTLLNSAVETLSGTSGIQADEGCFIRGVRSDGEIEVQDRPCVFFGNGSNTAVSSLNKGFTQTGVWFLFDFATGLSVFNFSSLEVNSLQSVNVSTVIRPGENTDLEIIGKNINAKNCRFFVFHSGGGRCQVSSLGEALFDIDASVDGVTKNDRGVAFRIALDIEFNLFSRITVKNFDLGIRATGGSSIAGRIISNLINTPTEICIDRETSVLKRSAKRYNTEGTFVFDPAYEFSSIGADGLVELDWNTVFRAQGLFCYSQGLCHITAQTPFQHSLTLSVGKFIGKGVAPGGQSVATFNGNPETDGSFIRFVAVVNSSFTNINLVVVDSHNVTFS